MTAFQTSALGLTAVWFALVVRFRRSGVALIGGLALLAVYTLAAYLLGTVTPAELGLGVPRSWAGTVGLSFAWLALMVACSPLADRLAARIFPKPPELESFRAIRQSRVNLIAGIAAAWLLGGISEELIVRGIVLNSIESFLAPWLYRPAAAAIAIVIAAIGAGAAHLYQGPRAAVTITQLSVLFGVLFVLGGHNLWAVMICHGLYDTIAFIRFAAGKSRYSTPEPKPPMDPAIKT